MKTIAYALLIFTCSSCLHEKAFYVSPLNGLNNPYPTIPLQSDSLRSAYYAGAAFSDGSANELGHDNSFSFQANLSASNNFKNFQAYYGTGILLGHYKLNPFSGVNNSSTVDPQIINQYAGKIFFGAIGFNGGINAVISLPKGEWRIVGLETCLYKEFGDYLAVRKQLPDSAATFINRKSFFGTLGVYTEVAGKIKYGSINLKFSGGTVLGSSYHNVAGTRNYGYFNFTIAVTVKKLSPYFQANFATRAANALFGINYRLGK